MSDESWRAGYDAWKTTPPPDDGPEQCFRSTSTECDCSRCWADYIEDGADQCDENEPAPTPPEE